MKVDKIDKISSCFWLFWLRNIGTENGLHPSRAYALVLVESTSGVVRVVERNFELSVRNISGCRQNEKNMEEVNDVGWLSETFYTSSFYKNSCSFQG